MALNKKKRLLIPLIIIISIIGISSSIKQNKKPTPPKIQRQQQQQQQQQQQAIIEHVRITAKPTLLTKKEPSKIHFKITLESTENKTALSTNPIDCFLLQDKLENTYPIIQCTLVLNTPYKKIYTLIFKSPNSPPKNKESKALTLYYFLSESIQFTWKLN